MSPLFPRLRPCIGFRKSEWHVTTDLGVQHAEHMVCTAWQAQHVALTHDADAAGAAFLLRSTGALKQAAATPPMSDGMREARCSLCLA